jgi:hypothetical protein
MVVPMFGLARLEESFEDVVLFCAWFYEGIASSNIDLFG